MAENIERKISPEQIEGKNEGGLTEIRKESSEIEMPAEVKRWMDLRREEVKQPQMPKVVTQTKPVVAPTTPADPKIVIPTTRTVFGAGFKKAIDEAGRWFSTFLFRMIKMKKGTIVFKDEDV